MLEEKEELVAEIIQEAKDIGIPVSDNIKEIIINPRTKSRLGCCKKETGMFRKNKYTIELSKSLEEYSDKVVREVIAHEILHTVEGCMNHGTLWKTYAEMMRQAYGYEIKRVLKKTDSAKKGSNGERERYKYKIQCNQCGKEIFRKRKSLVVKNPEKYSCRLCGGSLSVYIER